MWGTPYPAFSSSGSSLAWPCLHACSCPLCIWEDFATSARLPCVCRVQIGQGTYSNVYKARDLRIRQAGGIARRSGSTTEPESVRFMAREIEVLRRLDHPNIVKLEGLVTSRMSSSLYLVFEYMEHDLAGLAASPGITFAEEQVSMSSEMLQGLHTVTYCKW